jgi:hypothetical protein
MAVENILQGTDCTMRTFNINDSAGTAVLIADILDYHIYVYSLANGVKTNQLTFKKTPVGDDKSVVVVDTTTIGFIVDRTYTKTAPVGYLYAEIEVQMTASASYVSSKQNSANDSYIVCNIVESANPSALI